MARTSTRSNTRGPLVSPFSISDPEAAFVAYCNMPFASRAGFKKPTKAQWRKKYEAGRAKYLEENPPAARTNTASNPLATLDPSVIAVLQSMGIGVTPDKIDPKVQALMDAGLDRDKAEALIEALGIADTTDDTEYEARTPRDQVPTDAARNAVLWALNTESLLSEAYDAAQEAGLDYITQEIGQDVLSAHFGPLPANQR